MPVSTIAYGTEEGSVVIEGAPVRVPVDAPALAALAQGTGGQAYEAASGDELQQAYADIASPVGTTTGNREISAAAAGLAVLATAASGGAALARTPRRL